ncbi:MAG TPA: MBL fold metallo-hydrolase [Gemmatimonadales bacterium]|nr:MBL fold metallo-hydrolase [Gemmatimonadales bacterium]
MSRAAVDHHTRIRWHAALLLLAVAPLTSQAPAPRRFTTSSPCTAEQQAAGCLIVLGSGMPVPDPERAGPAYAVVFGDRTFLFDAGAGVMRRVAAAGLPIDGVTAAFLTHLHSDHTLGLPDLLLTTWVMGRRGPFPLVGPPGTQRMVTQLLAAWQEDITTRIEGLERGQPAGPGVTVLEREGGVVYDSAGVRIEAIKVPHGEFAVSLAYVIRLPTRTIVLSGDSAPTDALIAAATGADLLVHEVYPEVRLKPEPRPGGEAWPAYMRSVHTSDVEVGRLAVKSGVRRVLLSHIVRMGGTDAELLAGVRRGGYRGVVQIAQDLAAY